MYFIALMALIGMPLIYLKGRCVFRSVSFVTVNFDVNFKVDTTYFAMFHHFVPRLSNMYNVI